MSLQRCFQLGTAFVLTGVLLIWLSFFLLDSSQWVSKCGIVAGGAIVLIAPWVYRQGHASIPPEAMAIANERVELEQARRETESELKKWTANLENRQRRMAEQMIAYQSWAELPIPNEGEMNSPVNESIPEGTEEKEALSKQDRRVIQLIEDETNRVFDDIKANKYLVNDQFEMDLLWKEVHGLIKRVAQIYNPQSENPLLETSIEQLLRATSRCGLHLLVVLEQLPLSIHSYNIQNLYAYIRRAVSAYGAYKKVEPFLPYISNAIYAGRLAAGFNPVTLGAWWAASQLSAKGLKAATSYAVDRQAIQLLHDTVRVLAYEVAGIYGGDFRHRDADWIFGVELSDLVSRFKGGQKTLTASLSEVGQLSVANEYDRIFLYRCIVAGKNGQPGRFQAATFLSQEQRELIVKRLTEFAHKHFAEESTRTMAKWEKNLGSRLLPQ